ncbi:MAG: DUF3343 domain-containing protein [Gemmatimonadetes bacterium]|nr:DUF3343 domain-containing protein [Gemmatimonadota bacterium]
MIHLLTFNTTHHALLAEQVAHECGLSAEVTPAPPQSGAKCDLAVEYLPEEEDALLAALRAAGVEFRIFRADAAT